MCVFKVKNIKNNTLKIYFFGFCISEQASDVESERMRAQARVRE